MSRRTVYINFMSDININTGCFYICAKCNTYTKNICRDYNRWGYIICYNCCGSPMLSNQLNMWNHIEYIINRRQLQYFNRLFLKIDNEDYEKFIRRK